MSLNPWLFLCCTNILPSHLIFHIHCHIIKKSPGGGGIFYNQLREGVKKLDFLGERGVDLLEIFIKVNVFIFCPLEGVGGGSGGGGGAVTEISALGH